jgi:hypothetical protein
LGDQKNVEYIQSDVDLTMQLPHFDWTLKILTDDSMSDKDHIQSLFANWFHLAFTFDGSSVNVYLNGTQIGSKSWSGEIVDYSCPLFIGESSVSYNKPRYSIEEKSGVLIDSISIWNTSLDTDYISSSYKASPRLDDRHLVLYFPFDEGYGLQAGSFNGITAQVHKIMPAIKFLL